MSAIKNVAIIGGSGNIGRPILEELLAAGSFKVTALTRATSKSTFPEGVTVKKVDFESADSLKEALTGQDAVVAAVATAAVRSQQAIIDAAVAAGVKRFIPSEFGTDTRRVPGTPIGKILAGKVAIVDYLKTKESETFSWTALATGMFFDWNIAGITGIDLEKKTARTVDSGNEKFPASNVHFVGRAVVSVLQHPEQTANKYLAVASFNISINEVIAIVEELTGCKYTVNRVSSANLQKLGEEKLAKGDFSAFGPLVQVWHYADGAGKAFGPDTSANAMLGLKEDDLRATVKEWLVKQGQL